MKTIQVHIGESCSLTRIEYGGEFAPDISLDYIEHSNSYCHSDNETNLDIDKEKAIEIIKFLKDAFAI